MNPRTRIDDRKAFELKEPIWEYQPKFDTPKSYEAFVTYRSMSLGDRSLKLLAEGLGHRTIGLAKRWSTEYRWQERIEAWDADYSKKFAEQETQIKLDRHKSQIEAFREAQELMGRGQVAIAAKGRQLAEQFVELALKEPDINIKIQLSNAFAALARALPQLTESGSTRWAEAIGIPKVVELAESNLPTLNGKNKAKKEEREAIDD